MGKGKKKGQKGGDGQGDLPSVASLSITEDVPSTSQLEEEEDGGMVLGAASRKKNRKQKQADAKAAVAQPKQSVEAASSQDQPAEEPKLVQPQPEPASMLAPGPKPNPKPEVKKEEPKEEEPEGLGLGLGGGGKKRPRKKKSLAAAEAETKLQGSAHTGPLQPVPEQPAQLAPRPVQLAPQPAQLAPQPMQSAPPTGWTPQGSAQTQPGMPPPGFQPPVPTSWQAGQGPLPTPGMPAPSAGRGGVGRGGVGRGRGAAAPGLAQPRPGQAPQFAQAPYAPQVAQAPHAPQFAQAPYAPQVAQAPHAPQFAQAPYAPQVAQAPHAPQFAQAPYAPQVAQAPHAPQFAKAPFAPQVAQAPHAPQFAQAPQVVQAAQHSAQSSRASTPGVSATSTEVSRVTPTRGDLSCRYKIPVKVLGRSVRLIPTKVLTNYLPMMFKPIKVYRYDVIFKPDRPKKMLPAAFKLAIKKQYPKDPFIAFDQAKNCYTLTPLSGVPTNGSSRLPVSVEIIDPNGRGIQFEVSFKATGVVDLAKLRQHMDTGGSSLNTPSEEIQCVDVILRQGALEAYVKCGRQFFKRPNNPLDLSGGLEMWTGLFQSAIFTSHAFINIDVVHKGFPVHQSMMDAITKSFKLRTDQKIEDQRSRDVEHFISFIKGLRVIATLVGPPNNGQTREFICNGLVEAPAKLRFTCERNGKKETMTVADYFAKEKGYKIKYPYLNCMWVGPRDKNIYYPMELLQVSYGQARNRQLNEFQLSNMVREAAAPPAERKRKIEEVAACMNYSTNAFFKKFGLEISSKFLDVDAKILAPPNLDCGDRNAIQPRKGQWQTNRLVKPEALSSWGFIAIDCNPQSSNYETIRELLMSTGRTMGMDVAEPKLTHFNVRLTDLRNILFSALEKNVRFLFIIVATRGRDTYHRVKQMAERDVGILTQCIKEYTASRRMNVQTIKNILLKVNSKLMGVNQLLDSRTMPNCLKGGDVMIVGADVTHPSPEQTSIPSIAAVTASMDAKCFIYNIELSIQTPKKEMIVEFADMMFDHLKLWRDKNRTLPRKVYVFRDGVSEGQFAEVMNSELSAVHKAFQRFNAPKPEVLFLLVQKRHHTRFFTLPACNNVEPGTVVDTHIVHPKELDFYLVSHQAIKGTARPTRYHAVCNDGNIPHDEVEQLTYYLCHLYSRCMRSVSYPTPTYYAHLACFRARSLTFGQTFDNAALETKPQRLRVLDKMLQFSRMFFV